LNNYKVAETVYIDDCIGAYIGLGSNLGEPENQIRLAIDGLKEMPASRYISDSGLYLSRPMKPKGVAEGAEQQDQPDYYNAVALIETALKPLELLDYLQGIEDRQGRVRDCHWGPRTIDLDILLYGQTRINGTRLKVPHPGLCEREFVLYPLQRLCAELLASGFLIPELEIPGHGKLEKVIQTCPENGIKYVGGIT
jgi:2-amino-4-hydroxy-6-hydroxymethyldihydropteridine diphosphokinase